MFYSYAFSFISGLVFAKNELQAIIKINDLYGDVKEKIDIFPIDEEAYGGRLILLNRAVAGFIFD